MKTGSSTSLMPLTVLFSLVHPLPELQCKQLSWPTSRRFLTTIACTRSTVFWSQLASLLLLQQLQLLPLFQLQLRFHFLQLQSQDRQQQLQLWLQASVRFLLQLLRRPHPRRLLLQQLLLPLQLHQLLRLLQYLQRHPLLHLLLPHRLLPRHRQRRHLQLVRVLLDPVKLLSFCGPRCIPVGSWSLLYLSCSLQTSLSSFLIDLAKCIGLKIHFLILVFYLGGFPSFILSFGWELSCLLMAGRLVCILPYQVAEKNFMSLITAHILHHKFWDAEEDFSLQWHFGILLSKACCWVLDLHYQDSKKQLLFPCDWNVCNMMSPTEMHRGWAFSSLCVRTVW